MSTKLTQVEVKHASGRRQSKAKTGNRRGIKQIALRCSVDYGLSAKNSYALMNTISSHKAKEDKATRRLSLVPAEVDLRQSRGLALREGLIELGEGGSTQGKEGGRLADPRMRKSQGEEWMRQSQEEKRQVGRDAMATKAKKVQKVVDKHAKKVQINKKGQSQAMNQIMYYNKLQELIIKNFNNPQDLTASLQSKELPLREVDTKAREKCTDVNALIARWGRGPEVEMSYHGPNTLCVCVCRIYAALMKQDIDKAKIPKSQDVKICTVPEFSPGELLIVVKWSSLTNAWTLYIVTNVSLKPLACGLLRVPDGEFCKTSDGTGWVLTPFRRFFTGEYIRRETTIIGNRRGDKYGDMWGFNVAVGKVDKAEKKKLSYRVVKDEFMIQDLITKDFLPKSKPPEKPKQEPKKTSTEKSSQKQHVKAPDMRRQARTKLDFVLGLGKMGLGTDAGEGNGGEENAEGGGGEENTEGQETKEGAGAQSEELGGGVINVINNDHSEQAATRRILNRFATVSSWIRISVSSSSKFEGLYLRGSLAFEAESHWGLIGRVTPRCKSEWLRVQNLNPSKQARILFTYDEAKRRAVVERVVTWSLLAAWFSFRIDQDLLKQFEVRLSHAQTMGKAHTTMFFDGGEVDKQVEDEWDDFCEVLYKMVPGQVARDEATIAKGALGFCVVSEQPWDEEERQWRVCEDKVEDVLAEVEELEGVDDDVEMED